MNNSGEILSEEELRVYVDRWFAESPFAIARESAALSCLFSWAESIGLPQAIWQAVFDGLSQLNALPRNNAFWHNTNGRPTIFKHTEFCGHLLAIDPNDPTALWGQVASDLANRGYFSGDHWKVLCQSGAMSLEFLMVSGMYLSAYGFDIPRQVAECVIASGKIAEIPALLAQIQANGLVLHSDWTEDLQTELQRLSGSL